MKRAAVSGALTFMLVGCAAVRDLPPGYDLGGKDAEGVAIVSVTLSGKDLDRVSSFSYRVRQATVGPFEPVMRRSYFDSARQQARWLQDKDAQGTAAVRLIVKDPASSEPLDVLDGGRPVGRVASLRLPAGEYEFYDWKLVVPSPYGRDEFTPARVAPYRFRVEAGRAIYLGNLDLLVTDQDTYGVSVDDQANRDLALLAKKEPTLAAVDILHRAPPVDPKPHEGWGWP